MIPDIRGLGVISRRRGAFRSPAAWDPRFRHPVGKRGQNTSPAAHVEVGKVDLDRLA